MSFDLCGAYDFQQYGEITLILTSLDSSIELAHSIRGIEDHAVS